MTTETVGTRRPARTRVLDTATRLFYAEGVHAVGVDRIIATAGVAKATFYHHFASKDELVRAYVVEQSRWQRAAITTIEGPSPRARLEKVFAAMCDLGAEQIYRGCPFVNVAAEYPDPAHPVRQAVAEYRRWLRDFYRDLLAADGDPEPGQTADMLMLLRDGLAVSFDLDETDVVRAAVERTLSRILNRQP